MKRKLNLGRLRPQIRWGSVITIAVAIAGLFVCMVIARDFIHAVSIATQISSLEYDARALQFEITQDSTIVEMMKDDNELERYARERYYMRRSNEEVYIIE